MLPFTFLGVSSISLSLAQIAFLLFAVLASLVTPFGGFVASGMKRAHNIRDFSNLLPGHGAIVDRFDCIIVMCVMLYVYLTNVLYRDQFKVRNTLAWIHATMDPEQKVKLLYIIEMGWLNLAEHNV